MMTQPQFNKPLLQEIAESQIALSVGDIFILDNENPFDDDVFAEVLAIKNGYVQYRFIYPKKRIIAEKPWAVKLSYFANCYKTKINKTLMQIMG